MNLNSKDKKKLLITIGCSYTEGVGAYDSNIFTELNNSKFVMGRELKNLTFRDKCEINDLNLHRFHTHGWPSKLQKLLNYDKLINIGKSGASNSQCVKTWFETINNINLDEYDVTVIWLMTYSGRISFYRTGMIHSILPGLRHDPKTNPDADLTFEQLYDKYVAFLGENYMNDINLEAVFYLKIIQKICKLSNYNFFYFNADVNDGKIIDKLMENGNNSLNSYFYESCKNCSTILDYVGDNKSPLSMHPNEMGYDMIANRLFNIFKDNFTHILSNKQIENFEIEYLGEPKCWFM
jgi:hypothetical protein